MQDRFKFRYVFKKDFGGKTGTCYKMPIFDLDAVTDENFNKVIKGYTDYDYKLVSIDQCTGLKDKSDKLVFENDIVATDGNNTYIIKWDKKSASFREEKEDWQNVYHGGHHLNLWEQSYKQNYEVIGNVQM